MIEPNTPPSRVWSTIADLTTTHARSVLLIAGLVGAVSIYGVSKLHPAASIEAMLGDDEPATRALKRISHYFAGMEELVVLVSTSTPNTTAGTIPGISTDTLLSFAKRLSDRIASSTRLSGMCRAVQYRPSQDIRSFMESVIVPHALYYLSEEALHRLAARLTPDPMKEQLRHAEETLSAPGPAGAVAKAVLRDPLALRDFLLGAMPHPGGGSESALSAGDGYFSKDRSHLLIRLRGAAPSSDLDFADAFIRAIREAAEQVNDDHLDLAYTGSYAIAAAAQHSIRGDMIKSIVFSVIFLQVLYLFAYRNLWMLPAALAPVSWGILTALAWFSWLGMSLSPITAVIGAILAGLGIDYAIHSLSHYRSDRASGLTHEDAIRHTLTDIAPALLAACATTVVGFLAISQSSVQALREFGLLGAMGLATTLLATIFVLPAILSLTLGRHNAPVFVGVSHASIAAKLLRHATHHRRFFLSLGGAIGLGAVALIAVQARSWSPFEDDLTVMHPRPNEPLETQHRVAKLFRASPDTLLIHLQAETPAALTALAHRVDARLDTVNPEKTHVVGSYGLGSLLPPPLTPDAYRERFALFHADQIIADFENALENSVFNPEAFEDYKAFLRRLVTPTECPDVAELLRYPALAETVLPVDTGSEPGGPTEAITAVFTDEPLGDRTTRDIAINAIRSALDGLTGATLTGLTVIGHDTERMIRHDLRRLLLLAGGVVLAGLVAYFRSFRAMLLAMAPAMFGFTILIVCMRLFDLRLNTMNLVALPLLVGIGVDDGIFLVTISRRLGGRGEPDSLIDKLSASCHAVGMTSLTTTLTFGTLAFTSTPAIRSLGILMGIGVAASLIGAIWILVPLLVNRVLSTE